MDQQCSCARACVSHWNHMPVIWEPIALSVHMVLTVDHIWPLKACGRSLQQTSSHTHRHGISYMPTRQRVPPSLSGNISAHIWSNYDSHNKPVSMHCPAPVREQHPAQLDWRPWLSWWVHSYQNMPKYKLLPSSIWGIQRTSSAPVQIRRVSLSAFVVVQIKSQSEVWTGYCSWLNPESYVHLTHSLVLPPLILL